MRKLNNNILPSHGEAYLLKIKTDSLLEIIKKKAHWRDDKVKIFGKELSQPRKVAWCADENVYYTYSGLTLGPTKWIPEVYQLKELIEKLIGRDFNSALINHYRDGKDYMGWHSDDEKELGDSPVIASVSIGETRDFIFRSKADKSKKISVELKDGDLLIMSTDVQKYWQHSIPKRLKVTKERINITFRKVIV